MLLSHQQAARCPAGKYSRARYAGQLFSSEAIEEVPMRRCRVMKAWADYLDLLKGRCDDYGLFAEPGRYSILSRADSISRAAVSGCSGHL